MIRSSYVPIVGYVQTAKQKKVTVKNSKEQAEINGLREVIRSQGEFIQKIKKLIADYTGEHKNWEIRH